MHTLSGTVAPPDGGWGWMIVFGSWMVDLMLFGFFRGGGIVYIECMEFFGSTRSEAAWIPVLTVAISFLMAPIAGLLVYWYAYRQVVFLGGMIATTGLVICYYAPTITFIFIGYGIVLGIGFGLVLGPHLSIVGLYFKRHRALAMGITISGGAVGTFVIGPLIQFLIDEYRLRGAFLIMSAVLLHLCLAATLYRPIDYKYSPPPSIRLSEDSTDVANGIARLHVSNYSGAPRRHEVIYLENLTQDQMASYVDGPHTKYEKSENGEEINRNYYDFDMKPIVMEERLMAPLADIDETKISESDAASEELLDRALHFSSQRTSRGVSTGSVVTLPKIVVTTDDGLAWTPSLNSAEILEGPVLPLPIRSPTPPILPLTRFRRLLLDDLLILVSIGYGITVAAYVGIVVLLPDYIQQEIEDLSINDGVTCVSVACAGDLIARLSVGWLVDRLGSRKRHLYQACLLLFGIVFLVFPLPSSFPLLIFLCFMLGCLYGICLVHSPCFLADYFGIESLPITMGFMLAVAGVPLVCLGLIIGAFRDATGSYSASCWILGSVLVLTSLSWFAQPWLYRRHKWREDKMESESIPPTSL